MSYQSFLAKDSSVSPIQLTKSNKAKTIQLSNKYTDASIPNRQCIRSNIFTYYNRKSANSNKLQHTNSKSNGINHNSYKPTQTEKLTKRQCESTYAFFFPPFFPLEIRLFFLRKRRIQPSFQELRNRNGKMRRARRVPDGHVVRAAATRVRLPAVIAKQLEAKPTIRVTSYNTELLYATPLPALLPIYPFTIFI